MANRHFMQMIQQQWGEGKFLCVGLDSDMSRILPLLPQHSRRVNDPFTTITEFNLQIIEATKDLVCAYKPNAAFYEFHGSAGWRALSRTIADIKRLAPDVPIIYDAKRADIGNTNIGYATAAFDELGADALTVHPYLGKEALAPLLEREDKGIIILCRTSNPGAPEFQNLEVEGVPLYRYVAKRVAKRWNRRKNCMLVVGATAPNELSHVRRDVHDMPILIPGIGVQGGNLEAALNAGLDSTCEGVIINASRSVIFAGSDSNYPEAARLEALRLHNAIDACRRERLLHV